MMDNLVLLDQLEYLLVKNNQYLWNCKIGCIWKNRT